MSSPNSQDDPRTGRDRRSPTRARTFQDGKVDPVINNKRPLLTVGNGLLLVVGVAYGMYATGHLPQLDAFFNHADEVGKANNSVVVNALITYGTVIVGCVVLALFGIVIFALVNAHRRRASDPAGWVKEAKAEPQRRMNIRRAEDMPSLIMPIGKQRPERLQKEKPATAAPAAAVPTAAAVADVGNVIPAATATASPRAAVPAAPVATRTMTADTKRESPAKLAAMEAARKAEALADASPDALPSFVQPFAKRTKAPTKIVQLDTPAASDATTRTAAASPASVDKAVAVPAAAVAPSPEKPQPEAALAAAQAAALKAQAALAVAKAEAAMAVAQAEAAAAEAALAAVNAEVQPV